MTAFAPARAESDWVVSKAGTSDPVAPRSSVDATMSWPEMAAIDANTTIVLNIFIVNCKLLPPKIGILVLIEVSRIKTNHRRTERDTK